MTPKLHFLNILLFSMVLLFWVQAKAQEDIVPPNAIEGIPIADMAELSLRMNIGTGYKIVDWSISYDETFSAYSWDLPGFHRYLVLYSRTDKNKVKHLSYLLLSSGGATSTCSCSFEVSFKLLEALPDQKIRLDIQNTFMIYSRQEYTQNLKYFKNCPSGEICNYQTIERLGFIFDTSSETIRCLACAIPLEHSTFVSWPRGETDRQDYLLTANVLDNQLSIQAATENLTYEQTIWLGNYALP